jgi:two-component system response regulator FixJ
MVNTLDVYAVADDPVVCKTLQRLLETGNFRCHRFATITSLLEHMSELVDGCVLVDDATPEVDCIEFITRVRRAKACFPLILMTAKGGAESVAKATQAGAATLIEKPFSEDALFAAIYSVLLGKSAMDVLAVIQNQASATGECSLSVARIAERAHHGRAKTRAAIRLAESVGVIARQVGARGGRIFVSRLLKRPP